MPCKVTFERTDGGPAPDFGPAHAAGPARNQATTSDGIVEVPLAWGAYRVTASRGPEYALAQSDVTLAPGQTIELRLSPRRVVDTSGYLACDFHQHTMLGADAPVATRDRVVSNAAEGVEVAVASEHNVVADLEPIVRELQPRARAGVDPGRRAHVRREPPSVGPRQRLAPAASTRPIRAGALRSCAIARRARSSTSCGASSPGDFVIQVNHPRSGQNGYFDQLGFDLATGVGTDPGYDPQFDALEVWNGRNVDARAKVLGDFFALLRTEPPRDRDGGHGHARHRRAGGGVPADLRARRGRRPARSVDPGANRRRRARREGPARRRADERSDAARDGRRRADRGRRPGAHGPGEGARRERAVGRGRRAPAAPRVGARCRDAD